MHTCSLSFFALLSSFCPCFAKKRSAVFLFRQNLPEREKEGRHTLDNRLTLAESVLRAVSNVLSIAKDNRVDTVRNIFSVKANIYCPGCYDVMVSCGLYVYQCETTRRPCATYVCLIGIALV